MSFTSNYTSLVFDIGDVLFSWSPQTKTSISPKALRKILTSPTWIDYERGKISQAECYARAGSEFSIDPTEVGRAFEDARDSLQSNEDLISVIRHLKARSNGMLRVFAMSNISVPDYEVLRTKPVDWSLFDDIFTSAAVGERKPNLGFYKAVLSSTGADPSRTIFVDDKIENVLSARSLGMHGIIFDDHRKVIRALYNLLGDPVERGRQYLTLNAKKLQSVTDSGILLRENFAQLLILEATHDPSLVDLTDTPRTWNFFQGKPLLTTEEFPFDLDTTSLALTVMNSPEDVAHPIMDEMLDYIDDDGIIQTYFDHRRPRFDPVVCVNALTLFYSYGRGHQLNRTLHWIHKVLLHRAYVDGTRYYTTPECFLYFLGRLLEISNDVYLAAYLKPLLIERVQERIGAEGDALALSMRLRLCAYLGLRNDVDLRLLLPLQCEDGGWEIGWIYKYGSTGISIGNRGLTTSLAVKAILEMQHFPTPPHHQHQHQQFPSPSRLTLLPNLLLGAFCIARASLHSLVALLQRTRFPYQ
ncbi:Haloacid dehalogenase-like hydrolase-domain-containing protein [Suillus paluster]|uniref:Haloacid dehalogenase-like hydrolase-domain-containing protein n=1 Tax=Suillus paluster TaxID=48578 RepID=UPI001B8812A9|nr:Haloacid dehalogenase-like hydrolase-domain-containing protein [Suillus paluster]KAG1751588.1 Haloacid dehalogenase-like hydrolase-domain-containing protein [Suillus paluster]